MSRERCLLPKVMHAQREKLGSQLPTAVRARQHLSLGSPTPNGIRRQTPCISRIIPSLGSADRVWSKTLRLNSTTAAASGRIEYSDLRDRAWAGSRAARGSLLFGHGWNAWHARGQYGAARKRPAAGIRRAVG